MNTKAENILVVLPNWVGDNVLASPALRAMRHGFGRSRISYLAKPYLAELYGGCDWFDEMLFWPGGKVRPRITALGLINTLRKSKFDMAILLSNSFRAALTCSLGKIPRRIGYDRDGRGVMLTDKLLPDRYDGRFLPVSALKYYLSIADYLHCPTENYGLELFTEPKCEAQMDEILQRNGVEKNGAYALINPGASYGSSKCWPADSFAEVGDYLAGKFGLKVLIVGSPREIPLVKDVAARMKSKGIAITEPVAGLGALKSLVKRCKLMVTNDTGPRHFAAAFGVPVVTIFGATDPRWSETLYVKERQVRIDLSCGPCMKKTCPEKHHRCMKDLKPERVERAIEELLVTVKSIAV
jgi:heptosyltransferase-2